MTWLWDNIVPLIGGAGALNGLIATALYYRKRTVLSRCQRAEGKVVGVEEDQADGCVVKTPTVSFTDLTGRARTFRSSYGSSSWDVKPGDRLDVLYDPANPEQAEVVVFFAQWGMPLFFALGAVLAIVAALVLSFFVPR